jgi:hypothetical protein
MVFAGNIGRHIVYGFRALVLAAESSTTVDQEEEGQQQRREFPKSGSRGF